MELLISTQDNRQVVDITEQVQKLVKPGTIAINVHVAHTTCAVTTADLDPGTDLDLLDAVWQMIPKLKYRHPHNPAHVPAHLASSIIGPSVTVPVQDGRLILGSWQRVILVELDGPRERKLMVTNL
ncbi:MAG TPA: secondary thiamine-phosphate synthase enzyme YjbQ [Candidatus Saccharimonadales bacterium]